MQAYCVETLPSKHRKLPETQSCLDILAHPICQWLQDHHQHPDHIQDQLTWIWQISTKTQPRKWVCKMFYSFVIDQTLITRYFPFHHTYFLFQFIFSKTVVILGVALAGFLLGQPLQRFKNRYEIIFKN